jgi:hypothetical protein
VEVSTGLNLQHWFSFASGGVGSYLILVPWTTAPYEEEKDRSEFSANEFYNCCDELDEGSVVLKK